MQHAYIREEAETWPLRTYVLICLGVSVLSPYQNCKNKSCYCLATRTRIMYLYRYLVFVSVWLLRLQNTY